MTQLSPGMRSPSPAPLAGTPAFNPFAPEDAPEAQALAPPKVRISPPITRGFIPPPPGDPPALLRGLVPPPPSGDPSWSHVAPPPPVLAPPSSRRLAGRGMGFGSMVVSESPDGHISVAGSPSVGAGSPGSLAAVRLGPRQLLSTLEGITPERAAARAAALPEITGARGARGLPGINKSPTAGAPAAPNPPTETAPTSPPKKEGAWADF